LSKLVLSLRGGFGSRIINLVSAKIFTRHLGCELEFIWPPDLEECACPVELLYEGLSPRLTPVDPGASSLHLEDSRGDSIKIIEKALVEGRDVYFSTFYCLMQPSDMACEIFDQKMYEEVARLKPTPQVLQDVRQLPRGVIGLQIRRQDHWRNTRYSPLSLFTRLMDWYCEKDPNTLFYLSTDSLTVGPFLRRRYGSRLLQTEQTYHRDSPEGVRAALAEILTLAQTERLYRCNTGCFAHLVHLISRRPATRVALRTAITDYFLCPEDRRHDVLMHWDQKNHVWQPRTQSSNSLGLKIETLRYIAWTKFVTSDFYQRWPFHKGNVSKKDVT